MTPEDRMKAVGVRMALLKSQWSDPSDRAMIEAFQRYVTGRLAKVGWKSERWAVASAKFCEDKLAELKRLLEMC